MFNFLFKTCIHCKKIPRLGSTCSSGYFHCRECSKNLFSLVALGCDFCVDNYFKNYNFYTFCGISTIVIVWIAVLVMLLKNGIGITVTTTHSAEYYKQLARFLENNKVDIK